MSASATARQAVEGWAKARGYWLTGRDVRVSPLFIAGTGRVEAGLRDYFALSWCRVLAWALVRETSNDLALASQVLNACTAYDDADLLVKLDALQAKGDPLGELLMHALRVWPHRADDDPEKVASVERAAKWLDEITAQLLRDLLSAAIGAILRDDEQPAPDVFVPPLGRDVSLGYAATFTIEDDAIFQVADQSATIPAGEYTAQSLADLLNASGLPGTFQLGAADADATIVFTLGDSGQSEVARIRYIDPPPQTPRRRRHNEPPAHIGTQLARRLGRGARR